MKLIQTLKHEYGTMQEPSWKHVTLSLERPYKDDNGEVIPVLWDIQQDGRPVYQSNVDHKHVLRKKLERLFSERTNDFFDKNQNASIPEESFLSDNPEELSDSQLHPPLTNYEELQKLRSEVLSQLSVSLGEMSHARDLLATLLAVSGPQPIENLPTSSSLSAYMVSKQSPIISVQGFESQLVVGVKDEALRKAANVFRQAANEMERTRIKDEKYWIDALKVRRGNWRLVPAPLPVPATGKGADKTAKDFVISFGLEESPNYYRRHSICWFSSRKATNTLMFIHHRRLRLRISLVVRGEDGSHITYHNTTGIREPTDLEGTLKEAQRAVMEQEIFSQLVQESGNLSTTYTQVTERLVVIKAAETVRITFELCEVAVQPPSAGLVYEELCNVIYYTLLALLLRRHVFLKRRRLDCDPLVQISNDSKGLPSILKPIVDALQFEVFCNRVNSLMNDVVNSLSSIGVPSATCFDAIGDASSQLIETILPERQKSIGEQALLRIENQPILSLNLLSPNSLKVYLPQATLTISSFPQLNQMLCDEVERCLLSRICKLGTEHCEQSSGIWFVDSDRCVGRWEGCILNFRIIYRDNFAIDCAAFQLHKMTPKHGQLDIYSSVQGNMSLPSWVKHVIQRAPLTS